MRLPLAKEIGAALIFKVVALILMFTFFFSPADRVSVDDQSMERALIAAPPGAQRAPDNDASAGE